MKHSKTQPHPDTVRLDLIERLRGDLHFVREAKETHWEFFSWELRDVKCAKGKTARAALDAARKQNNEVSEVAGRKPEKEQHAK
jgi:hypothetical protein